MNILEMRYRALMNKQKSKETILPKEYQQVEYIKSTGTQYIDTGVLANENNSYKVKAQLTSAGASSQTVWGGRQNPTSGSNQLSYLKNEGVYQFVCGHSAVTTNQLKWDTNIHTFYANKNVLYVDEKVVATALSGTITSKNNVYLFATNTAGQIGYNGGSLNIFYCKIWNNDILVRDYIPCYRKADNVAGLYDLVNGVFYTNTGTGEFNIGAEV